jgi:methionine-rich copper-binding protein CopC
VTRRILALLAVVVASLVVGAAPALADFHLVSSVPAAGSTVLESPGEVKIIFDRPVNDVASSVQVTSSGSVYNDGVVTVEGGNTLVQPVRRLSSGNYSVSWTAASGPGAPSTSGKFGFTVSAPADRSAGTGQWIVVGVLAVIVAALGSTLIRRRLDRRNAATPRK